ncbi:hypothetical protein D3C84_1011750 [compost metagenome]
MIDNVLGFGGVIALYPQLPDVQEVVGVFIAQRVANLGEIVIVGTADILSWVIAVWRRHHHEAFV